MTALDDLYVSVRARMGVPTADGQVTDAKIVEALNGGMRDYAARYPWPWLEAEETIVMVDGTKSYAPTSTLWVQTISCRVSSSTEQFLPMQRLTDLGMVDALQQGTGAEGVPVFYAVWNEKLYFVPTPSATPNVLHRFRQSEDPFVDTSQETMLIPVHLSGLLIEYAVAMLFRMTRQLEDSTFAMERYERMLEDTAIRFGLRTRFSPSEGGGSGPQEIS